MRSFQAALPAEPSATAPEASKLTHRRGCDPEELFGPGELSGEDLSLALRLSDELFDCPTRESRALCERFGVTREKLTSIFRAMQRAEALQELFTFGSPLRRRVSFLRRELLPENLPALHAMFGGEVCLPNHVEFHPALMCNLRCRACPNCQADGSGDWHFLGYPKLGQPLTAERLHLLEDLFLDLGVLNFSFGGGGEPTVSGLTLGGMAHLRGRSPGAEISLYTNGIFPASWGAREFGTLVSSLNKIRFSIDASNAEEWSRYKGRPPEFFELLWKNISGVVRARKEAGSRTRIGASCLVSDLTCNEVGVFLERARDAGLDFCDIKAVETCFGEKAEYTARNLEIRRSVVELVSRVREGSYAPMDVVVDDSLLRDEADEDGCQAKPSRCWVAVRGRMLTVGPYGELYPCSDAANPGARERHNNKLVGQLTAFGSLSALREEFETLWSESLTRRATLSRDGCSYCVPSHNNFNCAVDKLYLDWNFGIMPEDQPFAGEVDHYLASRGARGG